MDSDYIVRDFKASDQEYVTQAWLGPGSLDEAEGRQLLREKSDTPFIRSLSVVKGAVIAVGAIAQSSLHPEHLWAYLEVEPGYRRRGVGSVLLKQLEQQAAQYIRNGEAPQTFKGLRIKASTTTDGNAHNLVRQDGRDAAGSFARNRGFEPAQTIATFYVNPGALDATKALQDHGFTVEDLATGSVELTQNVWDFYRASHAWDNPAQVSLGRIQQLFLGPGSGAHGALVVRDHEKNILAFAVSYVFSRHNDQRHDTGRLIDGSSSVNDFSYSDSRVMIGYNFSQQKSQVTAALRALIALLVYRDPIVVEVLQAAGELYGILGSLARLDGQKATIVSYSNVLFKNIS